MVVVLIVNFLSLSTQVLLLPDSVRFVGLSMSVFGCPAFTRVSSPCVSFVSVSGVPSECGMSSPSHFSCHSLLRPFVLVFLTRSLRFMAIGAARVTGNI